VLVALLPLELAGHKARLRALSREITVIRLAGDDVRSGRIADFSAFWVNYVLASIHLTWPKGKFPLQFTARVSSILVTWFLPFSLTANSLAWRCGR